MPYLISYLVAGVIFAVGALINPQTQSGRRFFPFLLSVAFWPVLALTPFRHNVDKTNYAIDKLPKIDKLQKDLKHALSESDKLISSKLKECLTRMEWQGEKCVTYTSQVDEILNEFWQFNIPPAVFKIVKAARLELTRDYDDYLGVAPMLLRDKSVWLIGFSSEFLKSISHTDAKLRGRILDAVGKLSANPMDPLGDTVKPLSASLSGFWRYRIGDHRLIYLPDGKSKRITLLYFGPRSDIYARL